MILDAALQFDTNVAITATAPSTNIIDLSAFRDVGVGDEAVEVTTQITAAFTAAGAATLTIQYQLSVDGVTWFTALQSDALPKANLFVGARLSADVPRMPPQLPSRPRFIRLNYLVASGPFTAGSVTSMSSLDSHYSTGDNRYTYGSGIVVAN